MAGIGWGVEEDGVAEDDTARGIPHSPQVFRAAGDSPGAFFSPQISHSQTSKAPSVWFVFALDFVDAT